MRSPAVAMPLPRLAAILLRLLVALAPLAAAAQEAPPAAARQPRSLLTELNRDVWTPYVEAFAALNADQYLALLAPDFVRVEGDQQVIRPRAEYVARVRRTFEDWDARDLRPEFQFRFTERIVRGAVASERGIYQFLLYDPEGNTERYFGTFHVLSRKIGEQWRITVEYDNSLDGTVTLADFQRAAAATDFSRF